MRCRVIFVLTVLTFISPALSVAITVKDTKGRSMDISVISFNKSNGQVKLKRADGAVFVVNLTVFDSESKKKILEAVPKARADLLVEPSVSKRHDRPKGSSSKGMKKQNLTASINIKNRSRDIAFKDGTVTFFLIERQTKSSDGEGSYNGKILSKEIFTSSLKPNEDVKIKGKTVASTNLGGWEYSGYLVIVQEKDGAIHTVETSIDDLKKVMAESPESGKNMLGLEVGDMIGKELSN